MSHFLDRLSYFSQPRETFAQAMAKPMVKIAPGKTPTVTAGHTTRSCAAPTA